MVRPIHRGLFRSSYICKCRIHDLGIDEEVFVILRAIVTIDFICFCILPHLLFSTVISFRHNIGRNLSWAGHTECNVKNFRESF